MKAEAGRAAWDGRREYTGVAPQQLLEALAGKSRTDTAYRSLAPFGVMVY